MYNIYVIKREKGNTKMFKVIVNLPNRKEIFPSDSEMGAIYFATLIKQRDYRH